ncbi:MAG: cation-translocating P-type ATPase [Myxococcota bacterium]|nr:cation-translocating P-type ATPase [Myxococcota bacterium]
MSSPAPLAPEPQQPKVGQVASMAAARQVELDEDEQREQALSLLSVFVGGGLLAVGWAWGAFFPNQASVGAIVQLLAVVIVSWPVFQQAAEGFAAKDPGSYTEQLVALAILAAVVIGDFITAGMVPLLMEVGHLLEERSVMGARAAIEGIQKLQARRATVIDNDGERSVDPEDLQVGDTIVVRPGETIPADGVVTQGASSVDQAYITGESMHEDVGPGSPVFAGTINLDGLIRAEVKGVGDDTALGRVIALLQEAEDSKAPITRLLERYAAAYLPIVLAIAAIVLFTTGEVDRAIAVLVVACPCALVLSGPVAMVAALAVASRWGILIKGSSFLERVSEVDTVVLDKTGTVTLGTLSVLSLNPVDGVDEMDLLATAGCCGHGSLHPVSRAAVVAARNAGLEPKPPAVLREVAGQGVEAEAEAGLLRMGRASWLSDNGLDVATSSASTGIAVHVARDGQVLGWLELADTPRPEAAETLQSLRTLGAQRLVLLTGDRERVAAEVAEQLGFDDFEAEVLPERKAELVAEEQAAGRRVMMVGDGVNDALALHSADVGVAVGAVINEVALGGADIGLMGNDLKRLPQMVDLANRTRHTINLNVFVGGGFSIMMLTAAAIGLINPMVGALLHNGGAIFVVMNSARLLVDPVDEATAGPDPSADADAVLESPS